MITLSDHAGTVLIFDNGKDLTETIVELQALSESNKENSDNPIIQLRYHAGISDEQTQVRMEALRRLFATIGRYPTTSTPESK